MNAQRNTILNVLADFCDVAALDARAAFEPSEEGPETEAEQSGGELRRGHLQTLQLIRSPNPAGDSQQVRTSWGW